MTAEEESCGEIPTKLPFRSYFALIPVFNKRKKSTAERNIIKIIHKSEICKSSPVLKTLLIENVRICCIIVESSGKQSVKILYASVPFMIALISKANPKFEKLLNSENVSSCLKIIEESNFDIVMSNVYHATVVIHQGVKKLYPTVCVTMLKDSLLYSEKSLVYLLKLLLHVLKSAVDFLYDNIIPTFHYLCRQNYGFAIYFANIFPSLIVAMIKYSVIASFNAQKSMITLFQLFRKMSVYFNGILNQFYADSALSDSLRKLCLFLKLSIENLRSTDACTQIELTLLYIFELSKPYIWKYFKKFFVITKNFIRKSLPVVKIGIKYTVNESIPLLRKFIEDNFENILNAYNAIKSFLQENGHYFKSFCCHSCRFMYTLLIYLYTTLQDVLPHIIRFSSNATISSMTCSTFILKKAIYFCRIISNYAFAAFESQKKFFCHLSKIAFKILKLLYKMLLELQSYMVLIFRIAFNELIQLIHISSPTLLALAYEVNSSVLYASRELIAKSCAAAKRITPSFYCSLKTVVPHTVRAANEVIRSSKNSVVIVFPEVLKGVLTIRPEVEECIVVLFSDGNKACLEVIKVSYFASCHLKDVARSVSSNLPVVYKAIHEVLKTTGCAAVEVSVTSYNAKSRMIKDLKKAHELVHTSFTLAEQELITVYMEFIFEINYLIPRSKRGVASDSKALIHINNYFFKLCSKVLDKVLIIFEKVLNLLDKYAESSAMYVQRFFKIIAKAFYHSFSLLYALSIGAVKFKTSRTEVLRQNIQKLLCHVFTNINYSISSVIQCLCGYLNTNVTDINAKIIQYVSDSISKLWNTFKSNVHATWIEACELAPEIWIIIENITASFWDFIIENIPETWAAWKRICSEMWKLICDFSPYIWRYLSSLMPVVWSSGRNAVRCSWSRFTNVSGFIWQHTVSLSSEYWMLTKTYVPVVWYAGCDETKRGWNLSCYLIENWWNFTVERCFSSWNFLHRSVAKSWRRSVVVTKTAYCVLSSTGSVLQKSYCMCCNSKNYAYIIMLEARPRISDFASNSLHVSKLPKMFHVFGQSKKAISSGDSDVHSSNKSSFRSNIKSYILSVVDSFSGAEKFLDYEICTPSKFFRRYRAKV